MIRPEPPLVPWPSRRCSWACRLCTARGFDDGRNVGTRAWSFRAHWLAWHAPRSIFDRTGL